MEQDSDSKLKQENEDELCGPIFSPPLYCQRYMFVAKVLAKHKSESVVDFGCSECGIARYLTEIETLESLSLVDIDAVTMEMNKNRIKPLAYNYLHKRKKQLSVRMFAGNATEVDKCIVGCEAVSMVEFIEHLVSEDLNKVILAVFTTLNPKLVVITTPNFEFNKLFPSYPSFRHYDHKFEWTRDEFQKCVEFEGIGNGPIGSESLGCCSQAAIFTNQYESNPDFTQIHSSCYKLIAESVFPHKDGEDLSPSAQLVMEINYHLKYILQDPELISVTDDEVIVPLDRLLKIRKITQLCDEQQLREHFKMENCKLTSDENSVILSTNRDVNWRDEYFSDMYGEDSEIEISDNIQPIKVNQKCCMEEESWD